MYCYTSNLEVSPGCRMDEINQGEKSLLPWGKYSRQIKEFFINIAKRIQERFKTYPLYGRQMLDSIVTVASALGQDDLIIYGRT